MDTYVRKTRLLEVALLLAIAMQALAAEPPGTPWAPPRTPWGAPDLNGVWQFALATPLERPEEFADKTHFS